MVLVDCGLMFPDADMPGIDLVLPDFTYLRENADRIDGVRRHPRPRGPRRRPRLPAARAVVPDLRLARSRSAWPATASRRPGLLGPHRADPGAPTASGADRPVRLRVHPGHPLGARTASPPPSTRRRASILHSGDFKLDLTPGRRPPHRPRPHRAIAERPRASACCCPTRPTPRSRATPRRSDGRRGAARPVPRRTRAGGSSPPASPATSTASSRSPTRPSPYGRVVATLGLSMKKNVRLAREMGLLDIPDAQLRRHRGASSDLDPAQGLRDLHRLAGRADVGAGADGGEREPLAQARRRRHRDPVSSHAIPGNETNVDQGHRRPGAPGRRGRPLRHRRRARHRPRQAGGAEDAALARPARVVHPGPRRVPPHGRPRPAGRGRWACPTTTSWSARTATSWCSTDDGLRLGERVPAGYLYVDGIVGDVGQGVLRDRRVLAEEGVVVVIVTVDASTRRGAHRARDHHPGLGVRARGRGPARRGADRRCATRVQRGVRRRAPVDIEALERRGPRAPPAGSSTSARGAPMIVPVVHGGLTPGPGRSGRPLDGRDLLAAPAGG